MPPTAARIHWSERTIYASRVFARRSLDLRARVVALRDSGEHVVVHARTRDLSRSGAGVLLTRELPCGTAVMLCLRLPGDAGQLCLQAVVARSRGLHAGLRFLRPTAQQRLLLMELCHS